MNAETVSFGLATSTIATQAATTRATISHATLERTPCRQTAHNSEPVTKPTMIRHHIIG